MIINIMSRPSPEAMGAMSERDRAMMGINDTKKNNAPEAHTGDTQKEPTRLQQQEEQPDIRERSLQKMDRVKIENPKETLKKLERVWEDINDALNEQRVNHVRYGRPEESFVDKEWARFTMNILNNLSDELELEGSYAESTFSALYEAATGSFGNPKRHIESKWVKKIDDLLPVFGREHYTETRAQTAERKRAREEALKRRYEA